MGNRMPVWKSRDRIRTQWLTWFLVVDGLYAVVNMFGKTESASQVLLRDVMPIPVWYGLILVAAIMIGFGLSVSGAALGMFAWLALVLASWASIRNGTALSYGGPILLALPAGCHFLIVVEVLSGLDADRERRQRQ